MALLTSLIVGGISALIAGGLAGGLSAIENNKNRAFQSQEAEKARQFQLDMASTSYQRTVEDAKKAGINPLAISGLNSVGMAGASIPSGSSIGNMANFDFGSVVNAINSSKANQLKEADFELRKRALERDLAIHNDNIIKDAHSKFTGGM